MTDELLDVVDNDDFVIGREMRAIVHQRGLQHRGIHVFLFTPEGRLLIQRRSKDRATSPSLLDCSVSEHVQSGEDYLTAARRGMREELGLKGMEEIHEIVTFRMNYGFNDNQISRLFQGFIDPVMVQFDTVEIEEISYFTTAELLERVEASNATFCRWFVQMVQWATGKPSELSVIKIQKNVHLPWLPIIK